MLCTPRFTTATGIKNQHDSCLMSNCGNNIQNVVIDPARLSADQPTRFWRTGGQACASPDKNFYKKHTRSPLEREPNTASYKKQSRVSRVKNSSQNISCQICRLETIQNVVIDPTRRPTDPPTRLLWTGRRVLTNFLIRSTSCHPWRDQRDFQQKTSRT